MYDGTIAGDDVANPIFGKHRLPVLRGASGRRSAASAFIANNCTVFNVRLALVIFIRIGYIIILINSHNNSITVL